ncbi:MAG: beta-ketoacyl-ACP synthase II [Prevotellaceae bacterium]|jgi:3-oxoacyl-[acyl-carrier-protein] synthase II|nr:beta-ketoacyl-ACP synthase II [Prevotellaceae bacterium]
MELKRVVVTGIGTINPLGNNVNDFFDSLIKGVSGAGLITYFDTTNFKTKFACEVKNYNPADYFDRKEVRKHDLYSQFGMIAADQAIADAGISKESADPFRIGVVWASGIGGIRTFFDEVKGFLEGGGIPRFSPFFVPKMIADICAGYISIKHGFCGPNYATVSACASSTHALIEAMNHIRRGRAIIMVAGGSESAINEAGVGGFNSMQALSVNNDNYGTASRPFDKNRDGFVIGEGAAGLILEEYEHAKARGAKIYAEVMGGGMSADAYHLTAPHPEGLGAASVMQTALDDSNFKVSDVDYINVHGTSTPLGDIAELKAIQKVFGESVSKINISSTKSMTGHLLGAAGALETLACICAIKNQIIPPTINFETPDDEIDYKTFNLTLNKAQSRKVNVTLSNTFGFGGHNAAIILKKLD